MEGAGKNDDGAITAVIHADHAVSPTGRELPWINPITILIVAGAIAIVVDYFEEEEGQVVIGDDQINSGSGTIINGDVEINVNGSPGTTGPIILNLNNSGDIEVNGDSSLIIQTPEGEELINCPSTPCHVTDPVPPGGHDGKSP